MMSLEFSQRRAKKNRTKPAAPTFTFVHDALCSSSSRFGVAKHQQIVVCPCAMVGSGDVDPADMTAAVEVPGRRHPTSIYDVYSQRRRHVILLATAIISIVVPFSDTIYLPALKVVQADLSTSQELVAASVSIYMFLVGCGGLVAGPCADRFGRRVTYWLALVGFLGSTIVCIFAQSIGLLVAFRALQGAAVAAFVTTGLAISADIFPPEQRGRAAGWFNVPMLVGPVIGPLLGGGLSELFGWRSCFIALAAFGVAVIGPLLLLVVPETHQWLALRSLERSQPEVAAGIKERDAILSEPPAALQPPWAPLRLLLDPATGLHAAVAFVTFGNNFASLTELPAVLSAPPYALSAGLVGVTYLSDGISGLIGSPLGGWLSDHAAAAHPDQPEARLRLTTLLTLLLMPAGLAVYAGALHVRAHLAVVVVGQFLIGLACAVCLPGVFSYATTLRQREAAAAAAAIQAGMFLSAGAFILVSAVAVQRIGIGPWFGALAGVQLLLTAAALLRIQTTKQRGADSAPGVVASG